MVIDFTHTIDNGISTYSAIEKPEIKQIANIEEDMYECRSIKIFTHTGTHIDSQRHMLKFGKYIDDYEIENFIGEAIILDLMNLEKNKIQISDLKRYEKDIENVDFILLMTGWSKYWCEENYKINYPSIDVEAAEYLSNFKLKGIGIDCISIGKEDEEIKVHKALLEKNILVIENLKIDNKIEGKFRLVIAPLKIKNSDGAPVRVLGFK